MKSVIIFIGAFVPGFKAGGPVTSILNLVTSFGNVFDFYIVTDNKDLGEKKPYSNIIQNTWLKRDTYNIYYTDLSRITEKQIINLCENKDTIYCCGCYNKYARLLIKLNKNDNRFKNRTYVAPMGNFSQGALKIKPLKKRIFIKINKLLNNYKNVKWAVTSKLEENDVKRIIGNQAKCIIAQDLPRPPVNIKLTDKHNPLKVIFLSRISPVKNLNFCIDVLNSFNKDIILDIYGNIEDENYWQLCKKQLSAAANIAWSFKGCVDSNDVCQTFSMYDVFFLPTQGENYCHAIYESLSSGCIPLISDKTPWQDLDSANCGYVVKDFDVANYVAKLDYLNSLTNDEFMEMKCNAVAYAKKHYAENLKNSGFIKIFNG